jgi:hypothetical protein
MGNRSHGTDAAFVDDLNPPHIAIDPHLLVKLEQTICFGPKHG